MTTKELYKYYVELDPGRGEGQPKFHQHPQGGGFTEAPRGTVYMIRIAIGFLFLFWISSSAEQPNSCFVLLYFP